MKIYSDENNNSEIDKNNNNDLGLPVLLSEVKEAVRRLPNNKAVGHHNLPAELLKTGNEELLKILCQLCNQILKTGKWPTDWRKSLFITLPKVTGTAECDEHRSISLISHTSKSLLRVLLKRSEQTAEEQFSEHQAGFRRGVGTRDQIFNLRIVMEKAREFNTPLYMAFIDYKKAFDSVRHSALWKIIKRMGVKPYIITTMRNLYLEQQAAARVEK